jgi:deferrochelatase/peroxidase EfeB
MDTECMRMHSRETAHCTSAVAKWDNAWSQWDRMSIQDQLNSFGRRHLANMSMHITVGAKALYSNKREHTYYETNVPITQACTLR